MTETARGSDGQLHLEASTDVVGTQFREPGPHGQSKAAGKGALFGLKSADAKARGGFSACD